VPEKVLTGYRAEGGLKTRIVDACGRQNLLGVGRADDAEFALPVHRCFLNLMLGQCVIKHTLPKSLIGRIDRPTGELGMSRSSFFGGSRPPRR